MPRFLSADWVAAANRRLEALGPVEARGSVVASSGSYTVCQVVSDCPPDLIGPGGRAVVSLVVAEGRPTLTLGEPETQADVVLELAYPDAVDLHTGRLDPAAALAEGRVRVRGDLSVLVAGQRLLEAAGRSLEDLGSPVTY